MKKIAAFILFVFALAFTGCDVLSPLMKEGRGLILKNTESSSVRASTRSIVESSESSEGSYVVYIAVFIRNMNTNKLVPIQEMTEDQTIFDTHSGESYIIIMTVTAGFDSDGDGIYERYIMNAGMNYYYEAGPSDTLTLYTARDGYKTELNGSWGATTWDPAIDGRGAIYPKPADEILSIFRASCTDQLGGEDYTVDDFIGHVGYVKTYTGSL